MRVLDSSTISIRIEQRAGWLGEGGTFGFSFLILGFKLCQYAPETLFLPRISGGRVARALAS
jgi:hypothetical protein